MIAEQRAIEWLRARAEQDAQTLKADPKADPVVLHRRTCDEFLAFLGISDAEQRVQAMGAFFAGTIYASRFAGKVHRQNLDEWLAKQW